MKKPIDKIKSSVFSRGLSLAKLSLSTGVKAAQIAMQKKDGSENVAQFVSQLIQDQAQRITTELGVLKGSAMKVGQMLSVYGEYFFPPEANEVLKTLQFKSPPLAWNKIEEIIKSQFTKEQLQDLEINPEALASASIGQVHQAKIKSLNKSVVLKVQYPGVAQAIDSDISMLKSILKLSSLLPKEFNVDPIFSEVKEMFLQEVDYVKELEYALMYKAFFNNDNRYLIPEYFPQFSTKQILTSDFIQAENVDSPLVKALSQERLSRLGENFLEHYMNELFASKLVQTDPHMGNYKISIDPKGKNDQWVFLDFGACRKLTDSFVMSYKKLIQSSVEFDEEGVTQAAYELQFLKPDDTEKLKRFFIDFCFMVVEPYLDPNDSRVNREFMNADGVYDWSKTNLPERLLKLAIKVKNEFSYRVPPREVIFIDRKTIGIFMMMKALNVKFKARPIILRFL